MATAAPAASRTPTIRARLRRGRTRVVLAVLLLVGGGILLALRGIGGGGGTPLGASDATPVGAKALVQVLRAQGVEVVEARSLERAVDEAGAGSSILLYDAAGYLGREQALELAEASDRLVVVAPGFEILDALAPGVRHAGAALGDLDDARCDFGPAERAGALSGEQRLFSIDSDAADGGWVGCFPDEEHGFAVVAGPGADGGELVFVGTEASFANATVDEAGNAALALGVTGSERRLVWYLPGPADAGPGGPTLGELTPEWVSPVLVLAALVTVAAGIWRGRRFGRLVVEDLPVHVPAGESAVGRGRLYAASSAREHALDQLRMGTIRRLAATLRLPRAANVDEVAGAAAAATGTDVRSIRSLLVDHPPEGDAQLVALARALEQLEHDVHETLRPARGGERRGAAPPGTHRDRPERDDPTGRRP
ncbi:DUF4350 domain-containing protein [Agromyces sp. G08B096]|uniref:DUF4350 domain-containing protein n=1 Tax=Agromyces sp. G08B096 TaxID=3156399 RepID=A0AAU7W512_9MICO